MPGVGRVTSYSRTPLGGHYTYVNQGPGYSHKWVQLFREANKTIADMSARRCKGKIFILTESDADPPVIEIFLVTFIFEK